jgi:lipopolysaccharide transport system permease protein
MDSIMRFSLSRHYYAYYDLLSAWTLRTLRARYQQSILGGLWAIIQPVAVVAIFTIIFTLFIPVDTGGIPYAVFSYTAMVPWTLFAASLTDMVDSLTLNMNLVSKIYFPREILPVAAMLARLLDFFIASAILVVLIMYYRMPLFIGGLLLFPVIVVIQLILALGLGLAGSALNVFYRDVRHLVSLGLQLWLYATPIIYPVTLVPQHLRFLYFLNPMAGVIESYRDILLYGRLPGSYLIISGLLAIVIFLIGFGFFKRVESQFADII